MPFDTKKFKKTRFVPRNGEVPVPDMKDFFGETEKPVWKVRGLNGYELGRAKERAESNKTVGAILEGIASRSPKEIKDAISKLVGDRNETPQDIAQRMYTLATGSVDPKLTDDAGNEDMDTVIQLVTAFPVEFYQITNKINELTGKGHVPGKPQSSGGAKKSGQQ